MRVRLDRMYSAIDIVRRQAAGYDSKKSKHHVIEVVVTEADLNKGIPLNVMTVSCEYKGDTGEDKFVSVEIYDEMDNKDPVITLRAPVKLD